MLVAGVASILVGVLNLALYMKLQSMVRSGRLPGIVPLDPAQYQAAKDRSREVSPWSQEGKGLRSAIRETDNPGTAKQNATFWAALSAGFLAAGVVLTILGVTA